MKKILFSLMVVGGLFGSSVMASDLSPSCKEYFDLVDKFIKKVESSPQHSSVATMKDSYKQSMDQVKALPKDQQETMCKQAIEPMKQALATMP